MLGGKTSPSPATRTKGKGLKFFTLSASLASLYLRVLLFTVIYLCLIGMMLATHEHDHPGMLFATSFAVLIASYFLCSILTRMVHNFGSELRNFRFYSFYQLWPLALRMLAVPLFALFVFSPAITYLIAESQSLKFRSPWIYALNLALVQAMFLVGDAFAGTIPAHNRFAQYIIKLTFPFRWISGLIFHFGFWIWFVLLQVIRVTIDQLSLPMLKFADQLAALVDPVMHISFFGPAVFFWLNPIYLMNYLHTSSEIPESAPLAFSGACIIAIIAMILRLRYWTTSDIDQQCAEAYDWWIETRASIPVIEPVLSENPNDLHPYIAPPYDNTIPPPLPSKGEISPDAFQLPQVSCAEIYLIEKESYRPVFPRKPILYIILPFVALGILYHSINLLIAITIWLYLTVPSPWPTSYASVIFPMRIWPVLKWTIQKRIAPLLPVDFLFSVVICVMFQTPTLGTVPLFLLIAMFRFMTLNIQIGFTAQIRKRLFIPAFLGFVILCICLVITMIQILDRSTDINLLWVCLIVGFATSVFGWLVLLYALFSDLNGLQFRPKVRESGQL